MASIPTLLAFLFLSHLVLLHSVEDHYNSHIVCPSSFECENLSMGSFHFPFTNSTFPECGLMVDKCDEAPVVQLMEGRSYPVKRINYERHIIEIHDEELQHHLSSKDCDNTFKNLTLPNLPFISFTILNNHTFFKCNNPQFTQPIRDYEYYNCTRYSVYYNIDESNSKKQIPEVLQHNCAPIPLPVSFQPQTVDNPFQLLNSNIHLIWFPSSGCIDCHNKGGQCLNVSSGFECGMPKEGKKIYKLILATVIPGSFIFTLLVFIIWHRYKWKYVPSYFLSRNTSSDPSSRSADLEGGSVFFGVPVFSYSELEEATNNFDPNQELGDGGFGTVYHGKLRDGREVAVKRLYEHNYKRVEQFKNEIEILTRLRHRNLVTLYGCTSRHSRELLLVYEYIPNGTVADHLHGDQAKPGPLPWSVRMNIAIETATVLAYLHASDIIHRDVKTNNILLDNNFCVKVADFGLSRLFPTDVTHISTAPQGTPGYVDPEYHQCYQLTDKSDVYSFGVVLIELISSLPAVDTGRHRHEINLARLAVNRIQKCAFNELIDQSLGFESDSEVQRMTTSVAELAFQCLQFERETRPTMDDVLETLMEIQGQDCKGEETEKIIDNVGVLKSRQPPPSPESDEVLLLKRKEMPPSTVSVTEVGLVGLPHPTQVFPKTI